MERSAWTDPRLDEKMAAIDHTHERIDASLDALRAEMRDLRRDLTEEMRELRREVKEESRALRSDFSEMQARLVQIGFGLVGTLLAALVALLVALTT